MKQSFMVFFLLVLFAKAGWCDILINNPGGDYDDVNVGAEDTFVAYTNALSNSNTTTETNWVNSVLSPTSVSFDFKIEPETLPIYNTTGTNTYAVWMGSPAADYFIVKNATYWALFENVVELDWGVFSSGHLPSGMNIPGDFTVSHVTKFDGNSVPEPALLLLCSTGLLGLAGITRRNKK